MTVELLSAAAGLLGQVREELLACFADDPAEARRCYLAMVEATEDPPVPAHPLIHGDTAFVLERLSCVPRDPEYTQALIRPPRPPLTELVRTSDDHHGITTAHIEHAYSLHQIATHLGCSTTTIHRRIHHPRHSPPPATAAGTKKT